MALKGHPFGALPPTPNSRQAVHRRLLDEIITFSQRVNAIAQEADMDIDTTGLVIIRTKGESMKLYGATVPNGQLILDLEEYIEVLKESNEYD